MSGLHRYLLVILIFSWFITPAQNSVVLNNEERLTYGVYYNWHFVWVKSGEVAFRFIALTADNGERWCFIATAHTFRIYDLFYKIRDTMITVCKPVSFEPEFFEQHFNHGKDTWFYRYRVPALAQTIYSEVRRVNKPYFRDTLKMTPGLKDMLATAYSFRMLEFSKLIKGQNVPFKMLVDNEIHQIHYQYLGKEIILNRNKIPFSCYKFSVTLLEGDFFPAGEHLKVWIDDSPQHYPVMVEAKILVGSVKAVLETAQINGKSVKFEL